jgi:hypothetical protein
VKESAKNRLNEGIIPLEKPFNSYSLGSQRTVLHATLQGVLNLLLYCPYVSLKV